jgi:hypothetical protein
MRPAALRKAMAHPFFSFFMTLLKAIQEASSIQTCTYSRSMNFVSDRRFADPDITGRKIIELARAEDKAGL